MLKNRNVVEPLQNLFLPAALFSSMGKLALVLGEATPNTITSNAITSFTTSGTVAEMNSTGFAGVQMTTDGDLVRTLLPIPSDLDRDQPIRCRVWWTSGSSTTADTIDWKVFYETMAFGEALSGTINDALDTVIAQDTVTGAYHVQRTAPGVINANKIAAADNFLELAVEMDTFAVGLSEAKFFLGLELLYARKPLGSGKEQVDALPSEWA